MAKVDSNQELILMMRERNDSLREFAKNLQEVNVLFQKFVHDYAGMNSQIANKRQEMKKIM